MMSTTETIWLTDQADDNTTRFFLTEAGDLIPESDISESPSPVVKEIVTHGMYPGSHTEWMQWIRGQLA